jgi:biotin operon repressor
MGKGLGKTQRRILDALAASESAALTVMALAEQLGVSGRQVRRAVHALADRGLVVLTKGNEGWRGVGEYGPRPWEQRVIDDPNGDDTRYEGAHWGIPKDGDTLGGPIRKDGTRWILGTPIKCRKEWYRGDPVGMPAGVSLFVWLPERHQRAAGISAAVARRRRRIWPVERAVGARTRPAWGDRMGGQPTGVE